MEVPGVPKISKLIKQLAAGGAPVSSVASSVRLLSTQGRPTRDAMWVAGALDALTRHMAPETDGKLLLTIVQTYSNLCRRESPDPPVPLSWLTPALPLIRDLLYNTRNEQAYYIKVAICVAVTNITDGPPERTEAVQAVPGLAARVVDLLLSQSTLTNWDLSNATMEAIANMVAGTDAQVDRCMDAGCVEPMLNFLQPYLYTGVSRAPALRAISNILAHSHRWLDTEQIDCVSRYYQDSRNYNQNDYQAVMTELRRNIASSQRAGGPGTPDLAPFRELLRNPDLTTWPVFLAILGVLLQAAKKDDFHSKSNGNSASEENSKMKTLCVELIDMGVLDQLQQMLREARNDESTRRRAEEMRVTVLYYGSGEDVVYEEGQVYTTADIVREMGSEERARQVRAVGAARRALQQARGAGPGRLRSASEALLRAGLLRSLETALHGDCCDLQIDAVIALSNIPYSELQIDDNDLIVRLISKLNEFLINEVGETHAICALVNMAGISHEIWHAVLNTKLVNCIRSRLELKESYRHVMQYYQYYQRLCSYCDAPDHTSREVLLSALKQIFHEFLWHIASLKHNGKHHNQSIFLALLKSIKDSFRWFPSDEEAIERLQAVPNLTLAVAQLMSQDEAEIVEATLDIAKILLSGNSTQVHRCVERHFFYYFRYILESDGQIQQFIPSVVAMVCELIGSHPDVVPKSFDHLEVFLKEFLRGPDALVLRALKAITLFCENGTAHQIQPFVSSGSFAAFCALMTRENSSIKVCVLDGIHHLKENVARQSSADTEMLAAVLLQIDIQHLVKNNLTTYIETTHRQKIADIVTWPDSLLEGIGEGST